MSELDIDMWKDLAKRWSPAPPVQEGRGASVFENYGGEGRNPLDDIDYDDTDDELLSIF